MSEAVYILNIETATKNCSVSVAKNGQTIACKEVAEAGYSHAEKLHVFIEALLAENKLAFADLSAIAVSQGPGSYTGLRIGVSAAKGLCFALDIPLIAIDTLESLARKATIADGLIIPMLDARRMEVYSAVFDSNYQKIREVQAEIITAESFAAFDEPVYFVGDCHEKTHQLLNRENFVFLEEIIYPSANEMSLSSFEKYKKSDTVDVAYFEPFYLKEFFINRPV